MARFKTTKRKQRNCSNLFTSITSKLRNSKSMSKENKELERESESIISESPCSSSLACKDVDDSQGLSLENDTITQSNTETPYNNNNNIMSNESQVSCRVVEKKENEFSVHAQCSRALVCDDKYSVLGANLMDVYTRKEEYIAESALFLTKTFARSPTLTNMHAIVSFACETGLQRVISALQHVQLIEAFYSNLMCFLSVQMPYKSLNCQRTIDKTDEFFYDNWTKTSNRWLLCYLWIIALALEHTACDIFCNESCVQFFISMLESKPQLDTYHVISKYERRSNNHSQRVKQTHWSHKKLSQDNVEIRKQAYEHFAHNVANVKHIAGKQIQSLKEEEKEEQETLENMEQLLSFLCGQEVDTITIEQIIITIILRLLAQRQGLLHEHASVNNAFASLFIHCNGVTALCKWWENHCAKIRENKLKSEINYELRKGEKQLQLAFLQTLELLSSSSLFLSMQRLNRFCAEDVNNQFSPMLPWLVAELTHKCWKAISNKPVSEQLSEHEELLECGLWEDVLCLLRPLTNITHVAPQCLWSEHIVNREMHKELACCLSQVIGFGVTTICVNSDSTIGATNHIEVLIEAITFVVCCAINIVTAEDEAHASTFAQTFAVCKCPHVEVYNNTDINCCGRSKNINIKIEKQSSDKEVSQDSEFFLCVDALCELLCVCYTNSNMANLVLSGYCALLLGSLSLTSKNSEYVNFSVQECLHNVILHYPSLMSAKEHVNAIEFLVAVIQEFILFQSSTRMLTADYALAAERIVTQLINDNQLQIK